jgi:hypothetical protein
MPSKPFRTDPQGEQWTVGDQLEFESMARHFPVLQKYLRLHKGRIGGPQFPTGAIPAADDLQLQFVTMAQITEKPSVGESELRLALDQ